LRENLTAGTVTYYYSFLAQKVINSKMGGLQTNIESGEHTLVVTATIYIKEENGYIDSSNSSSSDPVHFTFVKDSDAPKMSVTSPENITYATTEIPLILTVNKSVSWMKYSLDNQANVTISGNTTLTGLSEGLHNLVLYAQDNVGNIGVSNPIYFSIKTQQPEPQQSDHQTGFLGTALPMAYGYVIISAVVAVIVTSGYYIYKRRKQH
jgi:hypothetical protein